VIATLRSPADIAAQGEAVYESLIRGEEATRRGQFALIEVESGDFEVDPDAEAAAARLSARHPDRVFYVKKIGFAASEFIGGSRRGR